VDAKNLRQAVERDLQPLTREQLLEQWLPCWRSSWGQVTSRQVAPRAAPGYRTSLPDWPPCVRQVGASWHARSWLG